MTARPMYFMPGEIVILMTHTSSAVSSLVQDVIALIDPNSSGSPPPFPGVDHLVDKLKEVETSSVSTWTRNNGQPFSFIFVDGLSLDNDLNLQEAKLIALLEGFNRNIIQNRYPSQKVQLQVASPNWFSSALQGIVVPTGGPGGDPRPVEGSVPNDAADFVLSQIDKPNDYHVDVFILDTIPPLHDIRLAKYNNGLLSVINRDLNRNIHLMYAEEGKSKIDPSLPDKTLFIEENVDIYGDFDQRLSNLMPVYDNLPVCLRKKQPMPDHGLFVAGIIRSIAPYVNIQLIEVLNEYGVGTLRSIIYGLELVQKIHNQSERSKRPLIVNCSWSLAIPQPGQCAPDFNWKNFPHDIYLMIRMHWTIRWVIDSFNAQNSVFVAAAGNDAKHEGCEHDQGLKPLVRPQANIPAALPEVIGVSALVTAAPPIGASDQNINRMLGTGYAAADYSNIADRPAGEGLAIFGGLVDGGGAVPEKSILGVYTAEKFPNGELNTNGWAWWAGTSFSTAIATGTLGRLLSTNKAIRHALQSMRDSLIGSMSLKDRTDDGEEIVPAKQNITRI